MSTQDELEIFLESVIEEVNELKREAKGLKLKVLILKAENKELQLRNKDLEDITQNVSSVEAKIIKQSRSKTDTAATAAGEAQDADQVKSLLPARHENQQTTPGVQYWKKSSEHNAEYCTQLCLLGLKLRHAMDNNCPNIELHRFGRVSDLHPIDAEGLVQLLREQLNNDFSHNVIQCALPGSSGYPFKVTSAIYGYTIVGKGATDASWKAVSDEAAVYQILEEVQGSAVPVFLGSVDLVGSPSGIVRHILFMGWGGKMFADIIPSSIQEEEFSRSEDEIRRLGVIHRSLHDSNILWNTELNRALIIDFHRFKLDPQRIAERLSSIKRQSSGTKRKSLGVDEPGKKPRCAG